MEIEPTVLFCKGIPWSADIVLNDTRISDAGIYRCMVNNPPETADPGIGELVLSVLGRCLSQQYGSYQFQSKITK